MTAYGTGNETESISFASYDTLIWSMTMMNFTVEGEVTTNISVSAIECGLWYCVNRYESAVKDGNLAETIEPAASKREPDSWRPLESYPSLPNTINYNTSSASVRRTDLQLGEGFNLSQAAIYSISDLMYDTFTIKEGRGREGINANVLDSQGTLYSPTAMQSLYHSQDLEATFASLAKSMTNEIRKNSDNNTVANGREGRYIVVIRIRGWFLTLPVILIVGGAIFLAIVLHHTRKSKIAVWGTNALPVLALGGKMGPVFDDNDMRTNKMKKYAKRQFMQFPTLEQSRNSGRADSTTQHGDYEMLSPLRTSVKQSPSTGVVSIVSEDTLLEEERQPHIQQIV
jgi:hypothetical protein